MARRRGMLIAQRTLASIDADPSQRVDIFQLIEDAGVWLMFEPLNTLYGYYERIGDAAGISIHAGHPYALQRFTAAHEYGHHVLGHGSSFDDENHIITGSHRDLQEAEAFAYASNLLMPIQAIDTYLNRRQVHLPKSRPEPADVYQLSVWLGVSYRAIVGQLAGLKKITWDAAESLRKVSPLSLKTELAGGRRPENPRASVWILSERDSGQRITVDIDDELHIRLQEMPSSGYRWLGSAKFTNAILTLVEDTLSNNATSKPEQLSLNEADSAATKTHSYGGAHLRKFLLKASAPGESRVCLNLARPWEDNPQKSIQGFEISIEVAPPRISPVGRGISLQQREQLFAVVA